MEEFLKTDNPMNRRIETRTLLDLYYSVQFALSASGPIFQFKLRDITSHGLCILVRKDSVVLEKVRVSDTINMEFSPPQGTGRPKKLKTQIKHITDQEQNGLKGHFLVGLSILEGSIRTQTHK